MYLTKYLVSAWKLNLPSQELKAYELLGKFYFYAGNIEKAMMFHNRMTNEENEPESSGTRRLAISKLNSGSLGKITHRNIATDENKLYVVSSDDEVQEIIFLNENKKVIPSME